jgi:uncharacterized protein GlcG (DUF336 family)
MHELSIDLAERVARGGIDAWRKMGFHTTMAVIDSSGTLKAFLRDDKTGPGSLPLTVPTRLPRSRAISSRSTSVNASLDLQRVVGRIPPCGAS